MLRSRHVIEPFVKILPDVTGKVEESLTVAGFYLIMNLPIVNCANFLDIIPTVGVLKTRKMQRTGGHITKVGIIYNTTT